MTVCGEFEPSALMRAEIEAIIDTVQVIMLAMTVQHFLMFIAESFGGWQYRNLNDLQLRKITINILFFLFAMLYYGYLLHICLRPCRLFFENYVLYRWGARGSIVG
jgi:hypothetical protein